MGRKDSQLRNRMIFVVGARRSGTKWIQRAIASQPGVLSVPSETHLFAYGIAPLAERVHHGAAASARSGALYVDRDLFLDAVRDLCDRLFLGLASALDGPTSRILERTPWHAHHLPLIGAVYPDACVVHIVRDGRDVVRSLLSQPWGPSTVQDAAKEWSSTVMQARAGGEELDSYFEVRYEDLLGDPSDNVSELLEHLGFEPSQGSVRAALEAMAVPFDTDPTNPAIAAGKWRGSLSPAQLETFWKIAREAMEAFGYGSQNDLELEPAPLPHERESQKIRVLSLARAVLDPDRRSMARQRVRNAKLAMLGSTPGISERELSDSLNFAQATVDQTLASISLRHQEDLAQLLLPEAALEVTTPLGHWTGRGPEAASEMLDVLESVSAERKQVASQVHPGLPTFTVVTTWRDIQDRTWMETDVVEPVGSHVASLSCYVSAPSPLDDHGGEPDAHYSVQGPAQSCGS
ncbi:MAG: sulfotransferase [Actinobacteria bacterium]|nr:sulfotransferase [Actinomycetota bacterium]